ncbi:MAG: CDP-glucose 4,6-dehydratase [Actinomycetes bacterium]
MHYLITGHTGFKGAWLTFLLKQRGHKVSGVALDPAEDALYKSAEMKDLFEIDVRCDIRDGRQLGKVFQRIEPDVVIHLAAQALVRESYKDPITTFETNVLGTINVLKASQSVKPLRAQLIVTTDKVYKNKNQKIGYVETDELGGIDPYSASKAMADIATESWVESFENCPTAIARAGNVIGGGDMSSDRLIPDLVRSYSSKRVPELRFPNSVRPWQHVLDCVNGYLVLVDSIISNKTGGAWNFGPSDAQLRTVGDVATAIGSRWGVDEQWGIDNAEHPHEAGLLLLNSEKARTQLKWADKLNFENTVLWTADWYKNVLEGSSPREETIRNIKEFESLK